MTFKFLLLFLALQVAEIPVEFFQSAAVKRELSLSDEQVSSLVRSLTFQRQLSRGEGKSDLDDAVSIANREREQEADSRVFLGRISKDFYESLSKPQRQRAKQLYLQLQLKRVWSVDEITDLGFDISEDRKAEFAKRLQNLREKRHEWMQLYRLYKEALASRFGESKVDSMLGEPFDFSANYRSGVFARDFPIVRSKTSDDKLISTDDPDDKNRNPRRSLKSTRQSIGN